MIWNCAMLYLFNEIVIFYQAKSFKFHFVWTTYWTFYTVKNNLLSTSLLHYVTLNKLPTFRWTLLNYRVLPISPHQFFNSISPKIIKTFIWFDIFFTWSPTNLWVSWHNGRATFILSNEISIGKKRGYIPQSTHIVSQSILIYTFIPLGTRNTTPIGTGVSAQWPV